MQTQKNRTTQTQALVESALLIAIGFVLSYMKFVDLPFGGSVTLLSMLPILLIGLRRGLYWGLLSGVVYGMLQFIQKPALSPADGLGIFFLCLALDYIIAFGVLGLSGLFKGRKGSMVWASVFCIFLRFAAHTASSLTVWREYLDVSEHSALWAAMTYNATYMLPELLITTLAAVTLWYFKLDKPLLNTTPKR